MALCEPRPDGFYWVRLGSGWRTHGAWVVAERERRGWQVMDELTYYGDSGSERGGEEAEEKTRRDVVPLAPQPCVFLDTRASVAHPMATCRRGAP